jgi:hypothetical protein
VDMPAAKLVGINGITRVLLVYTCQQGVYPRGHVLPLRLPFGEKSLFILRIILNPQIQSAGKVESYRLLKDGVHIGSIGP